MKKIIPFCLFMALFGCSNYYSGEKTDHYNGSIFHDPVVNDKKGFFTVLKMLFGKSASVPWPKQVEVEKFDNPPQRVFGNELRVSNVGHVTFLIQTQGINILTDPVWSERASPVSFAGPKRVIDPGIKFDDLPQIDIVWISHNHYDHLDLPTIQKLWDKFKPRIITPLGNDKIISNYNTKIKSEAYDWGDEVIINDSMKLHLSPMQHWSKRGLFDYNKALWAALTIETTGGNIYFVGDSGYGQGRYFKEAHKKFGKYRLALVPMGAFEPRWFMKYAHMNPEEFVLAHIDLDMPISIPCHYDVFKLTYEGRGEASAALEAAKERHNVGRNIIELKVGQHLFVPQD